MIACYKHIIWDWNGTLLDDIALSLQVINQLLARRGKTPITQEDYRRNFGFPVIHFYRHLGLVTDNDSFKKISREFIDEYEARWFEECTLHSTVSNTLAKLSRMGITHSVLSAARQEALDSGIHHFGIKDHFIGLSGTDNIYAKGKIQQGHQWIKQLREHHEEIVLIGDTVHDYEVAQAIGTDCILMAHGHHSFERLSSTGVRVAYSMEELLPFPDQIASTFFTSAYKESAIPNPDGAGE